MNAIKNKIKEIYESFGRLNIYVKAFVIISIILGTAIRVANLNNLGFVYDTVTTQYTWGEGALRLGYYKFWTDYTGLFDYMPGSLLLIMGIDLIGHLFGGSAQAFVTTLKIFNWTSDVLLIFLVAFLSQRYRKLSSQKIYLLSSFIYLIPSLWFVSSVWGQMDTPVILLILISMTLLYLRDERNTFLNYKNQPFYKDLGFLSGIILGIGFWIKLQVILSFPILLIYFLSQRDKTVFKRYTFGFFISSFLISALPFVSNTPRVLESILTPFSRGDEIARRASTFWQLIGMTERGSDKLFEIYGFGPSVSLTGMLIFSTMMIAIYLKMINETPSSLWQARKSLKLLFNKLFPSKLTIENFILLSFCCSSLYFMLFTKMHSRYLHMGVIFSFLILACINLGKKIRLTFVATFILSISYFINQAAVYGSDYLDPIWVKNLFLSIKANLPSLLSTLCILGLYLIIWSHYENSKKI